jgi:hypothetical protein
VTPAERTFRAHVEAAPFRSGAARGKWRLVALQWPHAVIAVSAAERKGAPDEYGLRFELSGYPHEAPTALPWDLETDQPLAADRRPTGPRRVSKAFRTDWNAGQCLYLPCDRGAMPGHDAWRMQFPHYWWTPDKDITHYLSIVHELLNSADYSAPGQP